ncbi:MAG: hypothetical protein IKV17_05675 [Bacteroidaceae bacterium]|nr:hypothetical protein [Bacteroidaceae bacterium]
MKDNRENLGEKLLSESASAFLDNIDEVAELISPEEAQEYDNTRKRAIETFYSDSYSNSEQLLAAAEESESYAKKE